MDGTDKRVDREKAREVLIRKIESQRRILDDPGAFTNIDPNYLIADAVWRLRWIDCAPEGALHCIAPMQDKQGVPMGTTWSENIGPSANVREARIARGLHPITGKTTCPAPDDCSCERKFGYRVPDCA